MVSLDLDDAVTLTVTDDGGDDSDTTPTVSILDIEPGKWDNGSVEPMEYGQTAREIDQLASTIDTSAWKSELDTKQFTATQRQSMFRDHVDTWMYRAKDGELKVVVPKQHRATIVSLTHLSQNLAVG